MTSSDIATLIMNDILEEVTSDKETVKGEDEDQEDLSEKQVEDIQNEEAMPMLDSPNDKHPPMAMLSKMQQKVNKKENGHSASYEKENQSVEIQISERKSQSGSNKKEIVNFFVGEWQAFKKEKKTKLADKEKKITSMDFDGIAEEWKYSPEKKDHWENQKEKKEGERCSPLFYTILINIVFILFPNCMIGLDFMAAYEYLGGQWYLKRIGDPLQINITCRWSTTEGQMECFEKDIIWGVLTLIIVFLPGVFWSLGIFIQFAMHLRKKNPVRYDQKRMLFFFFMPLAAVSMVTFPFQLIIVSIISCFNNQDHWMILTSKIGIAEGLFNAHFQYLLQLFIFFVKADRHPSFFQYAAAFGSLVFLVWSRIESLLIDRGGHNMSPGQKAWWVCRFGPMFLFNSAFKVGSISLIMAMIRYNAIWFYGIIIISWLLLQFLFNEQYLSRKFYFLFIGAGMHTVSIAHISEEVKMIHAKKDSRKNILWITKLTDIQLKANMWFQNILWFIVNTLIIGTLAVLAKLRPDTKIQIFWPFNKTPVSFDDNKVFKVLDIIAPTILIAGFISLLLLWCFDFKRKERGKINKIMRNRSVDVTDGPTESGADEVVGDIPGWNHDWGNCPGCLQPAPAWHRYVSTGDITRARVVGRLTQIVFPLMNIWQNAVDKHTV